MFKKTLIQMTIPPLLIVTMAGCSFEGVTSGSEKSIKEVNISTNDGNIPVPSAELEEGDKNDQVKNVQKALVHLGYKLETSGDFNSETKAALKDFQSQGIRMAASGKYDTSTKAGLEEALRGKLKITPETGFNEANITTSKTKVLNVKDYENMLVLTNKLHALPDDYEPKDLTAPNVRFPFTEDLPKRYIRKEAAKALEQLFNAADKEGFQLYGQSGYRSYERQVEVFAGHSKRLGEKEARKVSAIPGQSEHQTGLAMDITSPNVEFDLTKDFGKTKEGQWVAENAQNYGFIIRYPKGKESITGYDYEPWHLRYVGKDVATYIYEQDITLEEYLGAVE